MRRCHVIRVRGHNRQLDSGETVHVRPHNREVKSKPRGRKVYKEVRREYLEKGYSEERAERIAGAVAYGPRD